MMQGGPEPVGFYLVVLLPTFRVSPAALNFGSKYPRESAGRHFPKLELPQNHDGTEGVALGH